MAEFVANFNLNNNNLDASFDLSEGASFDALFEIYSGSVTWGNILGDITNQTDLQNALSSKASNERVDGIVEAFNDDIESINDSITELSGNLDNLESTVTDNYNELNSAIDSNHQAISNINNTIQSYGDIVSYDAADFATSAQGALADTALQPNDNISELTNDVGYITSASLPVVNNNRITIQKNGSPVGDFTLNQSSDETINLIIPTTAADVGALPNTTTINDLTTTAQQEALNSGANTTNIGQISANAQAIQTETTNRTNADNNLQSQIDAITAASDVTDIVGTYAELQAYDTTSLPNNSIIKVLQDESRDDETTYYRWVITGGVGAWVLIGEEGPYYTKSESDSTFVPQTRTINGQALSSNINLTASDVGALPDSTIIPTVNNGTLTIQANGTTVGTFTANQSENTTANIVVPDSATWGNITGTLSNQTDLQNALDDKQDALTAGTDLEITAQNVINFTNDSGFITGINSSDVVNALGYTPYNSTNPNGYISSASVSTLTDVTLSNPANGQSLVYNSTSQKWENQTIQSGGVDLIAGTDLEIVPLLPSGHTQLKSITATGSQYIDTGIWLTDNFKAEIIGRFTSTSENQCLLGSSITTSNATYKNIVLAKNTTQYFTNSGSPWYQPQQTNSSAVLDTNKHAFVVEITSSNAKISVDSIENTGTYESSSIEENLFLFAHNAISMSTGSSAIEYAQFELESIKLYDNETLIFNGVPAKYGNQAGLYDTVTSTFMPSLGTSDFVAGEEISTQDIINFTNESGYIKSASVSTLTDVTLSNPANGQSLVYNSTSQKWENQTIQSGGVTDVEVNGDSVLDGTVAKIDLSGYQEKLTAGTDLEILNASPTHNLPTGYTEVEYVQSTGTQYIDTGVAYKDGIRVEIDFQYIATSGSKWLFGYNDYLGYLLYTYNGVYTINSSQLTFSASVYDKNHISATFTVANNIPTITATIGEETKTFTRSNAGGNLYNLQIFTVSGQTNSGSTGKCYGVSVYDNDTLVMELVPAKRDSDNKVGMYDLVGNTFIASSGSGNLIAGAEVVEQTIINFTNESGYITSAAVSSLTDVDLTGLSNGDTLVYNSTSQKWENGAGGSGTVTDVEVNGESVVTGGVAEIDLSGYQLKLTAGTDLEIIESSVENVPTGYTELESLSSNGNLLFKTGLSGSVSTKVTAKAKINSLTGSSQVIASLGRGTGTSWFGCVSNLGVWGCGATASSPNGNTNVSCLPITDIVLNSTISGSTTTLYGTVTQNTSVSFSKSDSTTTRDTWTIFGSNGTPYYAKVTFYGAIVFEQGGLVVCELYPARREADGELGYWDKVGERFITKTGTGTLTAGADVIHSDETVINFTNESGYITGITSTDVTTALGYTPYNSSNPNGYTSNVGTVTSVNGTQPDANGNVTIQSGSSRNIGEIVTSTIPLTDAGLHLLDGALLTYGSYQAFIDYIADLYDSGDYTAIFDTEANWQSAVTTYGVCGKFVYDSVNNTVRLPKYNSKIYTGGGTAPVVGNDLPLGIQNKTQTTLSGWADIKNGYVWGMSSGLLGSAEGDKLGITPDTTKSGLIAQLSNITTSLDGYYYIVIATLTKTAIQVDIDEIATDLNGKADVDLSNVPTSKGILTESYHNGASWYRVYSDGWCEQGGQVSGTSALTVNLLKQYANTNYSVLTNGIENGTNSGTITVSFYGARTLTVSSFTLQTSSSLGNVVWFACGYVV